MSEYEPPQLLEASAYTPIRHLMVDQFSLSVGDRTIERSFTGNMAKMIMSQPDLFLFTHKSAIPLADSVRAYYETLGYKVPELAVVNTKDEEGANREYPVGTREWSQRARSYDGGRLHVVTTREAAKLSSIVNGKRVAILDQYIWYGDTIRTAMSIAMQAGAASVVKPESAAWFHEANEEDIDFENLSSVHAPFMIAVGRAAAQLEVEIAGEAP